jgi:hypothetical protein
MWAHQQDCTVLNPRVEQQPIKLDVRRKHRSSNVDNRALHEADSFYNDCADVWARPESSNLIKKSVPGSNKVDAIYPTTVCV